MTNERRIAIVTGADSGIGKATVVELARVGHDIGITWHSDEQGAEDAAQEVRSAGGRAELHQVDLTDMDAAARVVDELAGALGGLHVLVNNAGVGASAAFVEHDLDELRQVLAVNLEAPFVLSQRAARRMIDHGTEGSIINVTSVHEHIPLHRSAAYSASKGGLGLLTKVMALELAEHGIRVNAVAPGEIATPMTDQHDVDPEQQDKPGIPWGRPGHAHEIGATIAFLASDGAGYITGASVVADGGLMLMAAVR